MRRLALLTAILALAAAPAASAHTLSKPHAANEAWLALYEYASETERWFEVLTDVDLARNDCVRFTRHRFECVGTTDYEAIGGEQYDDGTILMGCVAKVSVRFASRYSYRPVTRVYGERCF